MPRTPSRRSRTTRHPYPRPGILVSRDVMVPMRDGVHLATDIYRPAGTEGEPAPGKFPAILGRTSYDKSNPVIWINPVAGFFVPRGYAVVLQDLRGRGNSEGTGQYFHTANENEGRDGYDTVEWIASRPWSNGRVGMVGSSHGGIVQNVASMERPPHLSALWVDVAPTSAFDWEARQGGAFALHMFGALFLHGWDAQEIRDDPVAQRRIEADAERMRDLVWQIPYKPGHTPLSVVPHLEQVLFYYQNEGVFNDWWDMPAMQQKGRYDTFADIPAVFSGGWYDPFVDDYSRQFAHLAKKNRSPQRLIVGPWNHVTMRGSGATNVVEVDFGPDAKWGDAVYNEHRLRWFDRWLKGVRNRVEDRAPVQVFVMGGGSGRRTSKGAIDHGGRWREEKEWPLKRARYLDYYLQPGGALSTERPRRAGRSSARTSQAQNMTQESVSWTHDPDRPVPSIGANVTGFYEWVKIPENLNRAYIPPRARMQSIIPDGPMHQRERPDLVACRPPFPLLSERADVVVFQTVPLEKDIEVTGPIEVRLWVSSTARDTDFTVKLLDIYPPSADWPDGFHLPLCDSILRARFRNGFDHEEFMEPGKVHEITIPLPPVANLFVKGHRIRLDIASSNFPRFDINPNTGEPLGRHTHTVKAVNT
ncbi:MAG: CocE/NonD family hydrolase, partial [Chloroflexi bacterium]|nr:CocE/NonD family hydrolase [Chloroflexota bacterium]